MKPVSTEQLRNSPSITSVTRVVSVLQHIKRTNPQSAWKTLPSKLWPTSISQSWPKGIQVSGRREKQRQTGVKPASEEWAYSRDTMTDPAYKPPPPRFRLAWRLQNGGIKIQLNNNIICPLSTTMDPWGPCLCWTSAIWACILLVLWLKLANQLLYISNFKQNWVPNQHGHPCYSSSECIQLGRPDQHASCSVTLCSYRYCE